MKKILYILVCICLTGIQCSCLGEEDIPSAVPVTILSIDKVTATSVTYTYRITSVGLSPVEEAGVLLDGVKHATAASRFKKDENYTGTITGLKSNTTYTIQSYAVNDEGEGFARKESITTPKAEIGVESVTLSPSTLSLQVGSVSTLSATVSPSTATDKSITWSSSNDAVATVSQDGLVTAKSAGTATITATSSNGKKATCVVAVTEKDNSGGEHEGYAYVDLGLPSGLKWATCNVGATKPEDYGDYFAWGETSTKSTYNWSSYKWCNGSETTMTKYCTDSKYGTVDGKTVLDLADDAARANWGGDWRMPTEDEIEELQDKCTRTWTTQNGVKGYKVTSKINGNSIFLPAAGYRWDDKLNRAGSGGNYWSSTLHLIYDDDAYYLYFNSSNWRMTSYDRYYGQSVRAVFGEDYTVAVESVTVSPSTLSLEVGDTKTLTAVVSPSTATDKSITWSSSNDAVATVSQDGLVTAKSAGTATITATSSNGKKATCVVAVTEKDNSDGEHAGHAYVDLGLPSGVKWATMNVGATKPEGYGDYFAWGETSTKSTYNWASYKWCNGSETTLTKYCTDSYYGKVDGKTVLDLSDDAARANWGGSWRMPTIAEIKELKDNCTGVWTTQNGVKGYKVTSNKNGNSIFLPAAGCRRGGNLYDAGSNDIIYWSSSLVVLDSYARGLYFNSSDWSWGIGYRCYGLSVRAVFGEDHTVESVTLSPSTLSLQVGSVSILSATVSPSTATDKSITWSSSNDAVATVSQDGLVTAKSAGTATITATSSNGKKATCVVAVTEKDNSDGEHAGHAYVDLGLPSGVKWATMNVGATKPEGYGDYFAWGETSTKSTYNWASYKWCNGSETTMTKYCTRSKYGKVDDKTVLDLSDDAARANWGGCWRMPTPDEIDELKDNCTGTWTTQNGVNGYRVTSKINGNSIFLPAAGKRWDDDLFGAGSYGYYWSSTLHLIYDDDAYYLDFDSRNWGCYDDYRYRGQSVRAVCP